MKYRTGPTKDPLIAILAVKPAVIGTNVYQNNASPIPPNGAATEIRTERIVWQSVFNCYIDNTIPITNVTANGCVLMKSML